MAPPGAGKGVVEADPNYDWTVNTVLMQSTGLKDKNGVEIFEGDVVSPALINGSFVQGSVEFLSGAFHVVSPGRCKEVELLGDQHFGGIEVIGNIYENPHLLKG